MKIELNPEIFFESANASAWLDKYPSWMFANNDLKPNSYSVHQFHKSLVLTNTDKIRCLSNICTHKQSLIFQGDGSIANNIVCPIHQWKWNSSGCIESARGFEKCDQMDLPKFSIYDWQTHNFSGGNKWLSDIDLLGGLSDYFDTSNYIYHNQVELSYNFDWKIFFEIFLDLYHVKNFHPGLRSLTDCNTFEWTFGKHWSCQTAAFNRNEVKEPNYQRLYEFYKTTQYFDEAKYGAVWLGIYPNIMLEYYPGTIVVSTVWPLENGRCLNILRFYYDKRLGNKLSEFAEIQQKCFMVTADEDEIIGNRISSGRKLINSNNVVLWNHKTEEAGIVHYYNWLLEHYYPGQTTR